MQGADRQKHREGQLTNTLTELTEQQDRHNTVTQDHIMTGSTGKEAAELHHHGSAVAQCDFSLTSDLLGRKSINSNSVCNMLPLTIDATKS